MMRSLVTVVSTVLAFSASWAGATDLLDVWRAALQHDLEFSAADAAHQAGQARRSQGERLGRQVGDRTTLDLPNAENDTTNAELALSQARVALLMDRLSLSALAGQLDEAALQAVNATLRTADNR